MRDQSSRRRVLALTGAGVIGGLAGCLADDSPEPEGDTVDSLPTPVQGDPDADVTVAVYEDFSCPGCQQYHLDVYPTLREQFIATDDIRYEHRDFPKTVDDRWSWGVASAARAVQDTEGDATFFAFTSAIYEHLGSYSLDTIESVAEDVGASGATVRDAADKLTYKPVLDASVEEAGNRGVNSTPSAYMNGNPLPINENFYQAIDDAIENA